MRRIQRKKLCVCIYNTVFSSELKNGSNKLECNITLCWKGLPGITILTYGGRVSYEKSVVKIATGVAFTTLYFLLGMGPISYSVIYVGKACQGQLF
jgi:hypothetical protein